MQPGELIKIQDLFFESVAVPRFQKTNLGF